MSLPKSVSYQFVNMYVLDDEPTNDKFTEHVNKSGMLNYWGNGFRDWSYNKRLKEVYVMAGGYGR